MRMTTILATGLLLTAGIATSATAGTTKPNEVRTTINVTDLATQEGIQKVYQDLRETAEDSCRVKGPTNLANRMFQKNCETRLLNDFVKDVNHDGLTTFHKLQKTA